MVKRDGKAGTWEILFHKVPLPKNGTKFDQIDQDQGGIFRYMYGEPEFVKFLSILK